MPLAKTNGVELYYEEEGEGRPLLLIMGLSAQYLWWSRSLIDALKARGFRTIRFDNRDVGASSRLHDLGKPNIRRLLPRVMLGGKYVPPYHLDDLARDALGLLDFLGIEQAHVMGASMGGMIAQRLALAEPRRVASLTLMFTNSSSRWDGFPARRVLDVLLKPPPRNREETVDRFVEVGRVLNGRGYVFEDVYWRELGAQCFDHTIGPPGFDRQMAAVIGSGSTRERLHMIEQPTLVIHGTDDPLVRLRGGLYLARHIKRSRLLVFRGMGHHLPRVLHETVAANVEAVAMAL